MALSGGGVKSGLSGLALCAPPLSLRRRGRGEPPDRFDNWLTSRRLAGWHWSRIRSGPVTYGANGGGAG